MSMQYRARGHYNRTDRDSWITTVWRDTYEQAELDISGLGGPDSQYGYSKTWIVTREANE